MSQFAALLSAKNFRKSKGLTLIELLVALALGLGILLALSSVYVAAKQSFRFQDSTGRMQEDAAYALELMAKELRMTGYSGCVPVTTVVSSSPTTTVTYPVMTWNQAAPTGIQGLNPLATLFPANIAITSRAYNPDNILRGFDSGQSSMFSGTASTPAFVTASSIFFAGGLGESVSLNAAMNTTTSVITANTATSSWNGTSLFIISDCTSSDLFRGNVTTAGGVLSIAHAASDGNFSDALSSNTAYGTGTTVIKPQWVYYYIATPTGASTPSLYRINFDGNTRLNAQEIISNVESMSIHYGEANAANPLIVNDWRTTAADVTDWSRVLAVRIGLMMVSGQTDSNVDVVPTNTTLLGVTYTIPADSASKVRNEFSTTVTLRNRVAPR